MITDFTTLTVLRDEWQALQPLSAENEARLWKKLRLEWNYHSNHIEGNTLTYGETELLLLHDRTTGDHSHREYLEMKAHDAGIGHVRALTADKDRLITESDIRDLNRIILKEPFWKPAETPDGQPSRIEIIPGQYKTSPNNVRLPDGSMFYFASVEDTPPKMQSLAGWLHRELEAPTLHPVALAAKLHHDFVLIHPFDDGNGRVARLLVNYVLMRVGYLPTIVRTEDKTNYLTALQLADAGDLSALIGYFHQLTEWSLKLGIKAAKGESIEEPSDLEKEIAIFIRDQQQPANRVEPRTRESVNQALLESVFPCLEAIEKKLASLSPLFNEHQVEFRHGASAPRTVKAMVVDDLLNGLDHWPRLNASFHFRGYKGDAPNPFNAEIKTTFEFEEFQYRLAVTGNKDLAKKLYSELILSDERDEIARVVLKLAFDQVKKQSDTTK